MALLKKSTADLIAAAQAKAEAARSGAQAAQAAATRRRSDASGLASRDDLDAAAALDAFRTAERAAAEHEAEAAALDALASQFDARAAELQEQLTRETRQREQERVAVESDRVAARVGKFGGQLAGLVKEAKEIQAARARVDDLARGAGCSAGDEPDWPDGFEELGAMIGDGPRKRNAAAEQAAARQREQAKQQERENFERVVKRGIDMGGHHLDQLLGAALPEDLRAEAKQRVKTGLAALGARSAA